MSERVDDVDLCPTCGGTGEILVNGPKLADKDVEIAQLKAAAKALTKAMDESHEREDALKAIIDADPDDQALYLLRWILKKWGLPDDTPYLDVMGAMHVAHSHAHGYERYITAYKCNDKQGEIARQAARIEQLEGVCGQAEPWPLADVLARLIDLGEHAQATHNCDRHGYEEDFEAMKSGRMLLTRLRGATEDKPTALNLEA